VSSVVFLRGINVGGANLCKPAQLAKQLKELDIVNIGAVGTFVVRNDVAEPVLRKKFAVQLAKTFGIKCEVMIVPARDVLKLAAKDPFARQRSRREAGDVDGKAREGSRVRGRTNQPSGPDITRFVSVMHKRPAKLPAIPLSLPSNKEWLLKIVAVPNRFVVGIYRREMKAIGYLGKIEKIFGVPATTRSWNTFEKVLKVLGRD
jgi:uncharacterized protein (DUF1697 family)